MKTVKRIGNLVGTTVNHEPRVGFLRTNEHDALKSFLKTEGRDLGPRLLIRNEAGEALDYEKLKAMKFDDLSICKMSLLDNELTFRLSEPKTSNANSKFTWYFGEVTFNNSFISEDSVVQALDDACRAAKIVIESSTSYYFPY